MTDLEKLAAALREATAMPDADVKAETLRLAAENFARVQEFETAARPIPEAPQKGSLWKRTTAMFNLSNLRPALYATSCFVVAGAVFVAYEPLRNGLPVGNKSETIQKELTVQLAEEPLQPDAIDVPTTSQQESDEVWSSLAATSDKEAPQKQSRTALASRTTLVEQSAAPQTREMSTISRSKDSERSQEVMQGIFGTQKKPEATPSEQWMGNDTFGIAIPQGEAVVAPQPNNDQFAGEPENPVKVTSEAPVSTFSIDVDTAAYAYVRSTLLNGGQLRPDAVRVEEMVNYFTYDYAAPVANSDVPFTTQINVTQTPWNPDTQLVRIGIQGQKPALEDRPPLNLVFLIDTSGSMQSATKLPLLKQSFALMLTELRPTDQVAIVTYAGSAGTVLESTAASETATILNALDHLNAGGSTAGGAGLRAAYTLADKMRDTGEISRVLLATDGDFNVGINNPDDMKSFIKKNRDSGTYLSVLGFGRGNYRDDMMQTLAQNGNGTAAYIDTLAEAQKTLVDQLSGALFPIANDVKIQVEFNPATVAEYRLIGYETRALNREDFNNDKVDAGDIGAGHQVTALYEITPVGSPAILNDPLRYAAEAAPQDATELGFFKLRYKTPGTPNSQLITTPITTPETPSNAGFAAAIAGFGQYLKGSNYTKDWTIDDAITLAIQTKGSDPFGYRAEAIRLMKLAKARK
jgi:Ca-activated chloride channel family protein